ncbi:MAG: hypothetical protein C5S48_05715 [Candidatus Methanogaster sp.]|nr:MAG: hypothetical protein C5S48_05715 [ANME-2 cluster archaeon]
MTFTPDADLAYETTYNVTIGTGAEDLAGNPLAEEFSWEFTTTPPAAAQEDWSMTMSMTGVSWTDMEFGVNSSATDLFDDGIDDTAPFAPPDGYRIYLYEETYGEYLYALSVDIKSPGDDKNWTLVVAPGSKDITISWNPTGIPSDVNIQMQELIGGEPTGDVIDMNSAGSITVNTSEKRYLITATTSAAEEPPELVSCVIDPTPPVEQGTNITVDCLFSEKVTYKICIENATGDTVEEISSGTAKDPKKKWWNTTTETSVGIYTVNVTMDNSTSGMSSYNNTNTIEITPAGGDFTAPTVTANTPTGTDVPVSTVVSATFDEAMNETSVKDAFSIDPSVTGSVSWDGNTMTFTPDADLAYETTYNVTIGTGAEDLAGNNLAEDFVWNFTTGSVPTSPAPTITSSNPTSPVSDIAWATRTFSIEIDQTVNATWLINGSEVQTNESVTAASYTNTSAEVGCWNVSAVASNGNGTVMQEWAWTVTRGDVTSITVAGQSIIVIGENETFDADCYNANNYPINDVAVAWDSSNSYVGTINETTGYFEALHTGQTNITAASGGVMSDPVMVTVNGVGNSGNDTEPVIDDFVNATGNYTGNLTLQTLGDSVDEVGETDVGLGDTIPFKGVNVTLVTPLGDEEWVRLEMSYTDAELDEHGVDETTLDIYKFNVTADEWELVKVQPYCNGSGKGDHYLWVEVEHLSVFLLAGETTSIAPPDDDGGSSGGGGGGGSGTYPPGWGQPSPTSTATPAPTAAAPGPTVASTEAPTPEQTGAQTVTDEAPAESETTPTTKPTKGTPGFGAMSTVFVIAGLLVATYLVMRRRE